MSLTFGSVFPTGESIGNFWPIWAFFSTIRQGWNSDVSTHFSTIEAKVQMLEFPSLHHAYEFLCSNLLNYLRVWEIKKQCETLLVGVCLLLKSAERGLVTGLPGRFKCNLIHNIRNPSVHQHLKLSVIAV